jgi:hypothetical protein
MFQTMDAKANLSSLVCIAGEALGVHELRTRLRETPELLE